MDHRWLPAHAPYLPVWEAMREFTEARDATTPDEIWLVEHASVYTLGQAGRDEAGEQGQVLEEGPRQRDPGVAPPDQQDRPQ